MLKTTKSTFLVKPSFFIESQPIFNSMYISAKKEHLRLNFWNRTTGCKVMTPQTFTVGESFVLKIFKTPTVETFSKLEKVHETEEIEHVSWTFCSNVFYCSISYLQTFNTHNFATTHRSCKVEPHLLIVHPLVFGVQKWGKSDHRWMSYENRT